MAAAQKKNTLTALADAVGILLLCHGLVSLIFAYIAQRIPSPEWLHLLPARLAGPVSAGLCLLLGHWRLGSIKRPAHRYPGDRWQLTAAAAAALGLVVAAGEFIGGALRLGLPADTAVTVPPATAAGWLIVLVFDCLLTPLAETYFYRGLLQQAFKPWGERFAVLLAAIPAALAHHSLAEFLPQLALAVFLGWAVQQLGSLRMGAVLHVLAALLLFLLRYIVADTHGISALGVLILLLAGCLFCGVYGVLQLKKLQPPPLQRRRDPRNRQSRAELLLLSPWFCSAVIVLLAQTLLQSLAA